MKPKLVFTILTLLFFGTLWSQEFKVNRTITDESVEPLPGLTILFKWTHN